MLIGIDVGGTFTDGVLLNGSKIAATVKHPTDNSDLKGTILKVLDSLLAEGDKSAIERIVLSTTLVTNMLATGKVPATALLLLPGPGLPLDVYRMFADTYFLRGSVDFRGRLTEPLDPHEVEEALKDITGKGIGKIAIVAKFSNRNDQLEQQIAQMVKERYPDLEFALGSKTAGQLNFRRRLVTTYYSVMTKTVWDSFVNEITEALRVRGIQAEVDVLKADGGTMPLTLSQANPCETVFSGPAASTMGAIALTLEARNSVIIDIGGTTSDISLLIDGQPLYASKGARIQGHYTHIKAFSVCSIPLGGDSPIVIQKGNVLLEMTRRGNAACFGGDEPTVTDIFNHLYNLSIGDWQRSTSLIEALSGNSGLSADKICSKVEHMVIKQLEDTILAMMQEWENEPAYRVWEVIHGRKFDVQEIIGIGAASLAIIPVLARKIGIASVVPEYAPVANALGACVARPTLALKIHIDTQNGYWVLDQEGRRGTVATGRDMQMKEALELASSQLALLASDRSMKDYADDAEIFLQEQFNVIRGWSTSGKIFDVGVQIAPGLIKEYQGVSR